MKAAPQVVVVDTAILISALLGRSAPTLGIVAQHVALITTDRALEEAHRRVTFGLRRPDLVANLRELAEQIEVVPVESLGEALGSAAQNLSDAVPSRNATVTDAHILALAWRVDAEIWSHDRDFAGTGVASWSTLNLLRALAET